MCVLVTTIQTEFDFVTMFIEEMYTITTVLCISLSLSLSLPLSLSLSLSHLFIFRTLSVRLLVLCLPTELQGLSLLKPLLR